MLPPGQFLQELMPVLRENKKLRRYRINLKIVTHALEHFSDQSGYRFDLRKMQQNKN